MRGIARYSAAVALLGLIAAAAWWFQGSRARPEILDQRVAAMGSDAAYAKFTARLRDGDVDVRAVVLPRGSYIAAVVDQPDRQGTVAAVERLAADPGVLIAINGGYFREDFSTAGLYRLEGKTLGQASPLGPLSAIVGIDAGGALRLLPRDAPTDTLTAAIQAGPFVIDPGGELGISKQATARARRSIVAISDEEHVVLISTSEASLFDLARLLHDTPGRFGVARFDRAVNLHGGPSTTWVARRDRVERLDPAGPVRNFLVFTEKRPR